jgi:hypothetical protein
MDCCLFGMSVVLGLIVIAENPFPLAGKHQRTWGQACPQAA